MLDSWHLESQFCLDVLTFCIYNMVMKFDWDEKKNELNIYRHGIDFNDVPEIFNGPMIVKIDDRIDYGEDRFIGIGILGNIIAVVAFVEMEGEMIRIISARKANKHESKKFEKEIKNRLG